jgi:hypothetical protein
VEFLTPIPALIAAGIALPALLLLYVLKLRRRPLRVGSVLFWPEADAQTQANVPFRRLKWSWLLLLHLLALGSVLAALGRPALRGAGTGGKTIILLDCSASMNAVINAQDKPRTRLDEARSLSGRIVREGLSGFAPAECAVVAFAADAVPLQGFTSSRSLLEAALDRAEATDQPADLSRAMSTANALAASQASAEAEAGDATPPTIIIVTDGNVRPIADGLGTPAPLPTNVRVARITVPQATARNVAVTRLSAARDRRDATLARVFARVEATQALPAELPVTLALDGVPIVTRLLELRPTPGQPFAAGADVILEVPKVEAGVLTLTLGEPDALPADNAASCVLAQAKQPVIALVRGGVPSTAEEAAGMLLQDVLEELSPSPLTQRSIDDVLRIESEPSPSRPDMLVFAGVAPGRWPRVPGVFFGAWPGAAGRSEPVGGVVAWNRDDPLLRGVSLDTLAIESMPQGPPIEGSGVLARVGDSPLIERVPGGHVVVRAALGATNWPLTPDFAVFVANTLDDLTRRGERENGSASTTSEAVRLSVSGPGTITLSGPVTRSFDGAAAGGSFPAGLDAGVLPRAGVYVPSGPVATRAVAVNLADAFESSLADSLAGLESRNPRTPAARTGGESSLRDGRWGRRELWPYFLMLAGILLTIEWFVYAARSRV